MEGEIIIYKRNEQNHRLDNPIIRKSLAIKMNLEKVCEDTLSDGRKRSTYKCECGHEFSVNSGYSLPVFLFSGCQNCRHRAIKNKRLHRIWSGMIQRCINENEPGYKNYGGRGIQICDDWFDYRLFEIWAFEHGYADDLTIERVDVNGNYCPDNCKWITMEEQQRNTRMTYNNRYFTHNGETMNFNEWADRLGVTPQEIGKRVRRYGNGSDYVINPPYRKPDKHDILTMDGKTGEISDWLEEYGVSYETFCYRVSVGMTREEALKHKKYSRNPA